MLQLRCDLIPLMHLLPTNRTARLAAIPEDDRKLVEDRLREWDILPPDLRKVPRFEPVHRSYGDRIGQAASSATMGRQGRKA